MLTEQEKQERKEKAMELLKTLGNTADEVADSLRKMGIKGQRFKCSECPIGIFLARNGVSLYDVIDPPSSGNDLPGPIVAFISEFDIGHKVYKSNGINELPSIEYCYNDLMDTD